MFQYEFMDWWIAFYAARKEGGGGERGALPVIGSSFQV